MWQLATELCLHFTLRKFAFRKSELKIWGRFFSFYARQTSRVFAECCVSCGSITGSCLIFNPTVTAVTEVLKKKKIRATKRTKKCEMKDIFQVFNLSFASKLQEKDHVLKIKLKQKK